MLKAMKKDKKDKKDKKSSKTASPKSNARHLAPPRQRPRVGSNCSSDELSDRSDGGSCRTEGGSVRPRLTPEQAAEKKKVLHRKLQAMSPGARQAYLQQMQRKKRASSNGSQRAPSPSNGRSSPTSQSASGDDHSIRERLGGHKKMNSNMPRNMQNMDAFIPTSLKEDLSGSQRSDDGNSYNFDRSAMEDRTEDDEVTASEFDELDDADHVEDPFSANVTKTPGLLVVKTKRDARSVRSDRKYGLDGPTARPNVLKRILTLAENKRCADCNVDMTQHGPAACAVRLGVFVCAGCAVAHKAEMKTVSGLLWLEEPDTTYDKDLSWDWVSVKVQPLKRLPNIHIIFLMQFDNTRANDLWENTLSIDEDIEYRPAQDADMAERTKFIGMKYRSFNWTPTEKAGYVWIDTGKDKPARYFMQTEERAANLYKAPTKKKTKGDDAMFRDREPDDIIDFRTAMAFQKERNRTFQIGTPIKQHIIATNDAAHSYEWVKTIKGACQRLMNPSVGPTASDPDARFKQLISKVFVGRLATLSLTDEAPPPDKRSGDTDCNVLNKDGDLVASGSVKGLVEYLTHETSPDTDFLLDFMLTYRTFTTPTVFLSHLKRRFAVSRVSADTDESYKKKKLVVQLRVFNVLKTWMQNHYYDFDNDRLLLRKVVDFIDADMTNAGMLKPATQLRQTLEKQLMGKSIYSRTRMLDVHTIPTPIMPKKPIITHVLEIDPQEAARQLALMNHETYSLVKPQELLNKGWTQKAVDENDKNESPNMTAMINRFNTFTRWISALVLSEKTTKLRAEKLEWVILMSHHVHELKDYNTLMMIVAGLREAAVKRLKHTWGLMSTKTMAIWSDVSELMSPDEKFKKFRTALHTDNPPCAPYLGVYLGDLTNIQDGYSDLVDSKTDNNRAVKVVNFTKRRALSQVVAELQQYQQTPYSLESVASIKRFFYDLDEQNLLDDKTLYQLSLQVEPRGAPAN
eukprot:TRINITY_DN7456_c0_g1_i1.p1 TRINITY_DN7456_c0_g1~~TRINITY_DN7456_c0_g1_i1.p1  ORF type:complete len:968 (+),score=236.56 TRINITY_DN7456_c0_g1_i1:207-3110(+)